MKALRHSIVIAAVLGALAAAYVAFFHVPPAPAITLTSITGEKLATANLRGRVVLVNFWATDCAVCLKEMPQMVRTYEKYRKRGFELIAVAMPYDPPNYVLHYTDKNGLPFKVALDPMGEATRAFGDVKLTPTTILIDKRGNMIWRIIGEPDFAKLDALIEQKLAEPV
jgi:peroxiredoxin